MFHPYHYVGVLLLLLVMMQRRRNRCVKEHIREHCEKGTDERHQHQTDTVADVVPEYADNRQD